jgi:uncharacterized protein (TIGR02996 family)
LLCSEGWALTRDETFLQAIIDNPDDDNLRLVYADFLDDQGHAERADFLRVQIALAHPPEDPKRRADLEAREQRLLAEHGQQWLGKLGQSVEVWDFDPSVKSAPPRGRVSRPLVYAWEFKRGFVERVTVDTPVFLEHAEALFRAAPIRHLEVCPWLIIVNEEPPGDEVGAVLADNLHLFRPLSLRLLWAYPSLPTFQRVMHHPNLSSLTTLLLDGAFVDDEAAGVLASSPSLGRLEYLDLQGNFLGDSGLEAIAASSLGSLKTLDITHASSPHGPYGLAGLRTLVESSHLPNLAEVRADGFRLSEDERRQLQERCPKRLELNFR